MDEEPEALQVTVPSPKGGSGKTMTTILLVGASAAAGRTVTIVDVAPQRSVARRKQNGYMLQLDNC